LTEANEVLETGTKLNAHYKANSILLYYWGIRLMKLGCSTKLPVSAPSYSSTKKDVLLNHAVFTEGIQQGNSYLRLGVRLNYFENSINYIEPRINIRQQVSKQFALKLEGI
jgi:hypothetical protein